MNLILLAMFVKKDVWEDKRKKLDAAKAENQRLQDEAMQKQQEQIQKFVEYGNQQLTEKNSTLV